MSDRINEHAFSEGGVCYHCGIGESQKDKSCIWRDAPPRARPSSAIEDYDFIGKRRLELRAEQEAAIAGSGEAA